MARIEVTPHRPWLGSFHDTTTQSFLSTTTAYPFKFNTTNFSHGVSIVNDGSSNPTRITFANAGTYNVQFSSQFTRATASNSHIEIWLSKNGTNISNSSTIFTISGNSVEQVAAWNFLIEVNRNDYVQIVGRVENDDVQMISRGTATSPARPEIPSIILTVVQAD